MSERAEQAEDRVQQNVRTPVEQVGIRLREAADAVYRVAELIVGFQVPGKRTRRPQASRMPIVLPATRATSA